MAKPETPKGRIVHDPELQTMQKIQRLIEKLPTEDAKIRVLAWIKAKLDFPLAPKDES
jgi:hypothetical protein